MSNFTFYKLLDACQEAGCPICRMEQGSVERYIENHFYENVNSPKWRDRLRGSLGFCHEHAWLTVDRRLGDALGFSIIYRDILKRILDQLEAGSSSGASQRNWTSLLRQVPDQARAAAEAVLDAITPSKRCPVCEHREDSVRAILAEFVVSLEKPEMLAALRASDGLCLAHFQNCIKRLKDGAAWQDLLSIQREKMEGLKLELEEFIRKNDYREFHEGFGTEGNAWLRSVALVTGTRKGAGMSR